MVTLFISSFMSSGWPQEKKGERLGCFLGGCGRKSWKPGLVSVGVGYMSHSTWYRKVTLYMTVILVGDIWQLYDVIAPYLCCLRQVLIMNILIFPLVFPGSSPSPHQSDLNYLSPSANVLFWLDWMCLGRMWGFPKWLHFLVGNKCGGLTCVPMLGRGSDAGQQLSAGSRGWPSQGQQRRQGLCTTKGCCEVGSYQPEELCPWKGRGLCHSLLFRSVLFCEHQEYLCAWLLGTRVAELLAQVTLQGLVNLKKIKYANSEVTQTPQ